MTIEMADVHECAATECAYNKDNACHAKAITIGDGDNPNCDTFMAGPMHTRSTVIQAGVGACKVADCRHNEDLECAADNIRVAMAGACASCMTCEKR
jgi:hypothetical protein